MTRVHTLFAAIFLVLACPGVSQAQQVTLTPDQMLRTSARALAENHPTITIALAGAVLKQDPDNLPALLLTARAHRDLGQNNAARKAGQQAWGLARTPDDKFTAAVIMAQVTSSAGNRTLSQIWLRRAAQHASNDAQTALVRRDYNYVKSRNPLRFNLSGGAMPNSNINGGSNQDTITLFGLPFELSRDARALSGYQAYISGDVSYRIFESDKAQTRLGLKGYSRWNWLSEAAKAEAPDADASDYNYQSAAVTLSHVVLTRRPGQKLSFGLDIGRNWYGGERLSDFVNTSAQVQTKLRDGKNLTFSVRADAQRGAAAGSDPIYIGKLRASYFSPLKNGNAFRISLATQKSFSDDVIEEYTLNDATFEYFFGKPVLGTNISLGLNLGKKDYDFSYYAADGRHDTQISAFVDFRLKNASVYGFSPVLTLRREHTTSNVSLYSSDRTSIEIGFRSDF